MSYIACRRCGYKIQTPFVCRCDAPAHFIVACPKCGYRGVYSYADLIEQDEKMCRESCEKLAEFKQKLDTFIGEIILTEALASILKSLEETLKQEEENKKQ